MLKKSCTFAENLQSNKFKDKMFNERIKELREARQMPQRKLAAAMDIDTASYCKMEKGVRRARKEHAVFINEGFSQRERVLMEVEENVEIISMQMTRINADFLIPSGMNRSVEKTDNITFASCRFVAKELSFEKFE